MITRGFGWQRAAVWLGLALAATAAVRWKASPLAALAGFFAIPMLGGVVNYPKPRTPELAELASWARGRPRRTPSFVFPDGGRGPEPGIFRAKRCVPFTWIGKAAGNWCISRIWFELVVPLAANG